MPKKASPSKKRKAPWKMRGRPTKKMAAMIKQSVDVVMKSNIETKQSCLSSSDGQEFFHNDFITRVTNLLSTSQGSSDPGANASLNRIGDQIMLSGVSIKMILELNERYSMGTFRIFVVKCARGDSPQKLRRVANFTPTLLRLERHARDDPLSSYPIVAFHPSNHLHRSLCQLLCRSLRHARTCSSHADRDRMRLGLPTSTAWYPCLLPG